jgi:hypothetical protein
LGTLLCGRDGRTTGGKTWIDEVGDVPGWRPWEAASQGDAALESGATDAAGRDVDRDRGVGVGA